MTNLIPKWLTNQKAILSVTIIAILLIGIFLRTYHFYLNRSFWLDEAALALNIVNKNLSNLFLPLDYHQGAPIGFLLIEKLLLITFGDFDYILRVYPLFSGITALLLMIGASKLYLGQWVAIIGLVFFALSEKSIYYSSELKQYSSDILFSVLLIFLGRKVIDSPIRGKELILLGIIGGISLWFSHPSLFILPGIGIALAITLFREEKKWIWLSAVVSFWGLNLFCLYHISLKHLSSDNILINYWTAYFMPWPPWGDLHWFRSTIKLFFDDPLNIPASRITMLILLVGSLSLLFRSWPSAVLLIVPFAVTLFASGLKIYPFGGRLLAFLIPLTFIILAEGFHRLFLMQRKISTGLALIGTLTAISYCAYPSFVTAYQNFKSPKMGEHIKPNMAYLKQHWRKGDKIYVYYGAYPAFWYYSTFYGIDESDYIKGVSFRNEPAKYLDEINQLKPFGRVWFIFSHVWGGDQQNEKDLFLKHLDQVGSKIKEFSSTGASIFLYEFNDPS